MKHLQFVQANLASVFSVLDISSHSDFLAFLLGLAGISGKYKPYLLFPVFESDLTMNIRIILSALVALVSLLLDLHLSFLPSSNINVVGRARANQGPSRPLKGVWVGVQKTSTTVPPWGVASIYPPWNLMPNVSNV